MADKTDTEVSQLIINRLTRAQYESIVPSDTELYFVTDEDLSLPSFPTTEGNYVLRSTVTSEGTGTASWSSIGDFPEISSIYGVSGTLTIKASDWSSGKCTATIDGLNDTDALIVSGSTSEDQKKIGAANLFASASSSTVTFTAETAPTEAISLNYFIARGK